MGIKEEKKTLILDKEGHRNGSVYSGILELIGKFGYLSLAEVIYGFGLSDQEARNRLKYLTRQGIIEPFPSHAEPQTFYCLKMEARPLITSRGILKEISDFNPKTYRPNIQNHDRMLIRIYSAIKQTFGHDLEFWVPEKEIRGEESFKRILNAHKETRVLDGFFQLNMVKALFRQNPEEGFSFIRETRGPWRCGLELEISQKKKARYLKQFDVLSELVYDRVNKKQRIDQMIFFCGDPHIQKILIKAQQERADRYGRCVFAFGNAEAFLKDPKRAPFLRLIGKKSTKINGKDLNWIQVKVKA